MRINTWAKSAKMRQSRLSLASASVERAPAGFDVAQALAISQLGKSHGEKLLPAGKLLGVAVAAITGHRAAEIAVGEKADELREDALAVVHPSMLRDRKRRRRVFQIAASKKQM